MPRGWLAFLRALSVAAIAVAVENGNAQQTPPGTANLPIGPAGAPAADSPNLQQTATRQEQIRSEAKLLVARLDEVIAEYTRNGLAKGEDFEGLKAVRGELGSLSDEEMEQVVALLKQSAGDPEQMAKAYAGQKDISVRLKQILAAHERQQDLDALASAVRQLADRQSANLSAAIDAARLAAQDKSDNGQAAVTASEQAQQSEEAAIGEEVKLIVGKLNQMDTKYADAAAQLEKVPPEASTASDALGGGRLDDAKTAETTARQQLEDVVRALAPAGKQEEPAQNQAAGQLAELARDQRALLAKTSQLGAALARVTGEDTPEAAEKAMYDQIKSPTDPLAKKLALSELTPSSPADQIRNHPAMKAYLDGRSASLKRQEQALQARLAALSGDEAALAAKAQMVRDDLQKTAKDAGAPMANALTQMNSAQEALAESDGDQAAQEETDAANQLDQAQRLAEQSAQNDASQAQAAAPGRDQQLKQLQDGVNELTNRETAAVQQGDALKTGAMAAAAADLQANLAGKAQALQKAAADEAPASAPALGQAAGALQNAAKLMQAGGQPAQAEAAQQSALQNLAQAGQQLAQEAAAAAQQKQALADLENQMAGLGKVIARQQQLGTDTEKAVDAGKAMVAKTKQFAREQEAVRTEAEKLREAVNPGTPDAAKALDHADVAMGDAAQKLTDASAEEAEPRQQAALAALYQAQDALADRMQGLAQELGEPAADQAGAQALAALGKAEAQTAAAQQALGAGESGDAAMHQLDQAGREAAQAGAQPQALPQGARDAMREAEQALGGAAAAAGAGQGQQARAQAAQAGQALAQAQSAIEGAQAGIAEASPADQAQDPAAGGQSNGTVPGSQSGQGAKGAKEKNWNDMAGAATAGAQAARGADAYLGLPDRDRAAIQQSQAEKYPQEYGSMIEEYMRSLASDAGGK